MDADRLARLTDKQRACLRLVYAHMSSKEIALHLGVEPGTIDQYIKAAMRILGVSDRRAAARLLAEYERNREYPPATRIIMQEDQTALRGSTPAPGAAAAASIGGIETDPRRAHEKARVDRR